MILDMKEDLHPGPGRGWGDGWWGGFRGARMQGSVVEWKATHSNKPTRVALETWLHRGLSLETWASY